MKLMKVILCAVTAAAIAIGAAACLAEAENTQTAAAESGSSTIEAAFEADTALIDTVIAAMGGGEYADMANGVRLGDRTTLYCGKYLALPMQSLLAAIGQNITVDGKAGESTFEALNEVQEAVGLPVKEEMDETCMNRLFLCAYCVTDPEGAKALLGEDREAIIEACALQAAGRDYEAKFKFETLSDVYSEAAERAAACVKAMPADGELYRTVDSTSMTLTIALESAEEGKAVMFKIYNDAGNAVCALFLNGTGSVMTQLPGGTYSIHMGTGNEWYGAEDAFGNGDGAQYQAVQFDGGSDKTMLSKGQGYTLHINTADNADAPAMTEISWAEF